MPPSASRRSRRRRALPLTPLIDVVFILLLFFLLAARLTAWQGLPVDAGGAGGASGESALLVEVHPQGLRVSGAEIDMAGLLARVAALPDAPVALKAGAGAPVAALVAVLDGLAKAGVADVILVESEVAVGP